MLRRIVATSLQFRRLIIALAVGLLVFGVVQARHTTVDQLPEFAPTTVEVRTEALGLSAVEVEQLITVPLEQDLLNGVPFVEEIHSESVPGLSSVVMTFEDGTALLDARQLVAERVAEAAVALPGVSAPPQMLQPLSSTSRVLTARLSSEELSPIKMSVLARWQIAPRLLGVEGVANVSIWGWRDRQLQVLVDPQRLEDAGVSLQQIVSSTGNGLWVSPLTFLEASTPGTAGFIDTPNQRFGIRHELPIRTASDLAKLPIEDDEGNAVIVDGQPLELGDVTDVVENHQPLIGDALFGDGPGLLLVVEKFPGASTLEVTEGVEDTLHEMAPGLRGLDIDTSTFRPATSIESSAANLIRTLGIGTMLLMVVLALLLWEWRAIVTAATAIIIAAAVAGTVLYLRGAPANTMVVAGLLMALAVVIDDAVVDVGNLTERLRRRRTDARGVPVWRTVVDATVEMRSALLFATVVVVAALVPAFFLEGQPGAFLPSIVVSYLLATVAAMLVAVTLTPALGLMLLAGVRPDGGSPFARWIDRHFDRSFRDLRRARWAYAVGAVLILAGVLSLPFLERSSSVELQTSDLLVSWDAAPGTSLPETHRVTTQAVEELRALPGVRNVSAHVGRAIHADEVVNVNSGEIWVNLEPSADRDATIASMERILTSYPGLSHDVLTYAEERMTDVLQGTDEDVVVRVYGANADVLRTKAEEIREMLAGIDGIERPTVELPPTEPTLDIEVDLEDAQRVGVSPGEVRRSAAILLSGLAVGNLFEEQKVFDVVVWGEPEIRRNLSDVRDLLIETPTGRHVRLGDVADVTIAASPTVIRHESVSNYLDVSASVVGRDAADVAADVERAMDGVTFPLEHHAEVRGAYATEASSSSRILAIAIAAAIAAFLLLQAAFSSWRLAALGFLSLAVAGAGGAVAALVAGGVLTIGSFAGFVAVLGIAARNVIVLIRGYQRREREGAPFDDDLVIAGTRERAAPVVIGAVATMAALLPIALAGDTPGLEVAQPMAVVMIGGVVASAILTLVVLPALYLRHGFVERKDDAEDAGIVVIPEAEHDVAVRSSSASRGAEA